LDQFALLGMELSPGGELIISTQPDRGGKALYRIDPTTGAEGLIAELSTADTITGFAAPLGTGTSVAFDDGAIRVLGSAYADRISVGVNGNWVVLSVNGVDRKFSRSVVRSILIRAGDGSDVVSVGAGVIGAAVYGDAGDDRLIGGNGADSLTGGNGKDYLSGNDGDDLLRGLNHADRLFGGAGNDRIYGDAGNDLLDGGPGRDRLYGGVDHDTFFARDDSRDALDGGGGSDSATLDAADSIFAVETSTLI
ncbi:MAG: calcium-binding protein, partial [Tepidisphaeraceae bacterium]